MRRMSKTRGRWLEAASSINMSYIISSSPFEPEKHRMSPEL
jgi:hypothetical protein